MMSLGSEVRVCSAWSLTIDYITSDHKPATLDRPTCLTALSRSQSPKIMRGDFPPNSSVTLLTLLSAALKEPRRLLIDYMYMIVYLIDMVEPDT